MSAAISGWSKKLVGYLLAVTLILLNRKLELGLSEADVYALVGGASAYAIGQGIADHGKEAEKVKAVSGKVEDR